MCWCEPGPVCCYRTESARTCYGGGHGLLTVRDSLQRGIPAAASGAMPPPMMPDEDPIYTLSDIRRDTMHVRQVKGDGAQDREEEIIAESNVVQGYKYGPEYVTLSEANMENIKIIGKSCVSLIGFMREEAMPRHHLVGATMVLQGNDKVEQCIVSIAALADYAQQGCVGIARAKLGRDNTADPYQVALVPPKTTTARC